MESGFTISSTLNCSELGRTQKGVLFIFLQKNANMAGSDAHTFFHNSNYINQSKTSEHLLKIGQKNPKLSALNIESYN